MDRFRKQLGSLIHPTRIKARGPDSGRSSGSGCSPSSGTPRPATPIPRRARTAPGCPVPARRAHTGPSGPAPNRRSANALHVQAFAALSNKGSRPDHFGQRVASLQPSLVVLELGVNDMSNNVAPATTKADLLMLGRHAHARQPGPGGLHPAAVLLHRRHPPVSRPLHEPPVCLPRRYATDQSRRPASRLLRRDRAAARLQHRHVLFEESDVRAWIKAHGNGR
jgi:hypothetical protein